MRVGPFQDFLEAHGVTLEVARGCLGLTHDDGAARDAGDILVVVIEGIAGDEILST